MARTTTACRAAFVAALLLTLIAVPTDVVAIADWRQNAIDTAGMVSSTICLAAWLYAGLLRQNQQTRNHIDAAMRQAQRQNSAAYTLSRLTADEPTLPIRMRRVQ